MPELFDMRFIQTQIRRFFLSSLVFCCLHTLTDAQGTEPVQISDPELELEDNTLNISYRIRNSKASDQYHVRLEVLDAEGQPVQATALSGDVGKNVTGEGVKRIRWDLEADSVFMDADIFVTIHAEVMHPPEEQITVKPDIETPVEKPKSFNRAGIIFQSLAFPGLGLSRMSGKPHWIRGLAAYGCLAGSIYYNQKAIETYEGYQTQTTIVDAQNSFQDAENQDKTSEILAYTAAGIWLTDLIWTWVGSSDLSKKQQDSNDYGFSINTGIEPVSGLPVLAIRYHF